jgi:hypothetical protein
VDAATNVGAITVDGLPLHNARETKENVKATLNARLSEGGPALILRTNVGEIQIVKQ